MRNFWTAAKTMGPLLVLVALVGWPMYFGSDAFLSVLTDLSFDGAGIWIWLLVGFGVLGVIYSCIAHFQRPIKRWYRQQSWIAVPRWDWARSLCQSMGKLIFQAFKVACCFTVAALVWLLIRLAAVAFGFVFSDSALLLGFVVLVPLAASIVRLMYAGRPFVGLLMLCIFGALVVMTMSSASLDGGAYRVWGLTPAWLVYLAILGLIAWVSPPPTSR